MAKSLRKCGTIAIEGQIKISVDEIDTILLSRIRSFTLDESQFYSKITYNQTEINKDKKFASE